MDSEESSVPGSVSLPSLEAVVGTSQGFPPYRQRGGWRGVLVGCGVLLALTGGCAGLVGYAAWEGEEFKRKVGEGRRQLQEVVPAASLISGRRSASREVMASIRQNPFDDADLPPLLAALARWRTDPEVSGFSLELDGIGITDAGLKLLAESEPSGELVRFHLVLKDVDITDSGLEALAGMRRLDSVALIGTRVTPEGITRLRRLRYPKTIDIYPSAADRAFFAPVPEKRRQSPSQPRDNGE